MGDYNYRKFSADRYDLDSYGGPRPGDKAPDFALHTVDGHSHKLLDFDGDFLVLETGSITCPLFQSRRKGMETLVKRYPETAFRILYVREAHPGQNRPQHSGEADKTANARALQQDKEGRLILVDTFEGAAHKAYGSYPDAVVIINRNGCVVYASEWNNPAATGRALAALKAGKPAGRAGLFLPARPPAAIRALKGAGKGAAADFLRSLPGLVWSNLVKRNLRVLSGRAPKVQPDTRC